MKFRTMDSTSILTDGLPLRTLLSYKGSPVAYEGQMILVQGQAKSGKSRFVQNLLHGWLVNDDNELGLEYGHVDKVGLVTTEMSDSDLKSRWRPFIAKFGSQAFDQKMRMINATGKLMEGFTGKMSSADDVTKHIKDKFITPIVQMGLEVLIIDQIADLHITINSEEWWSIFMQELNLMAQQNNMLVVFILHENETQGFTPKNRARGHVGSIAVQKVTAVVSVVSSKDSFTVDFNRVRNSKTFKIRAMFDDTLQILKGVPVEEIVETKPGRKKKDLDYSVIGKNKTRQELVEILGKLMKTDKEGTINNKISLLYQQGIITKTEDQLYSYFEIDYLTAFKPK